MPGIAQAALEVVPLDAREAAIVQFRSARDDLIEALVAMLRAGLTVDDLMDECGVPRGGMRSALRAMIGRYDPDDLLAALDAQKGSPGEQTTV